MIPAMKRGLYAMYCLVMLWVLYRTERRVSQYNFTVLHK